jgi:RNA polymerase sigma-70 factor (ECF subfamily)
MEKPDLKAGSSLITDCRNGDAKAFRALYGQFSKAMYNISIRIVNNSEEAEDVLQEAFLKAFQDMERFENENAFGGWLKRVVINCSIDLVRKRKITFVSIEDEDPVEEEDEELSYTVETLRKCIQKLPDNYRIVLTLFLFEEQSHKEIASLLNITEVTSKTHYHRAKKKLLQLLKEHRS